MKLLMPCMACFQELGKPTNEFVTLEFHDDGHYEVCCSRGHTSVTHNIKNLSHKWWFLRIEKSKFLNSIKSYF